MLEAVGLSLRAGAFHLHEVSLRVPPQTCHALVGPSGHGKTLLLEALAGLRSLSHGAVSREGDDITQAPPERRGLAYVPQDLALFPHLTVAENVRYALRWNPKLREGGALRVEAIEERLGITHLADRKPGSLSGGERQRVAFARALASGTRLLLLDEPFSALHEALRREMRRLLLDLQRDFGLSILLVTHDLEEAFSLGETVSVMMEGRLIQSGPRAEVHRQPACPRVASFLGISNQFDGRIVGQEGPMVRVHCPGLGRDLRVSEARMPTPMGDRVIVGIRSEEVRLVREGQDRPDPWNHFSGRIVFRHDRSAVQTLVFQPGDGGGQAIDIDLATRTWRRMERLPESALSVSLDPVHLFGMVPDGPGEGL